MIYSGLPGYVKNFKCFLKLSPLNQIVQSNNDHNHVKTDKKVLNRQTLSNFLKRNIKWHLGDTKADMKWLLLRDRNSNVLLKPAATRTWTKDWTEIYQHRMKYAKIIVYCLNYKNHNI